jgi:hypothetical protein
MSLNLFLDESGGRPWPPPWGKNYSRFYVIGGVILTDEQHRRVAQLLPRIVRDAFAGYPKSPTEFHYGDLINKRDAYSIMPPSERYELANRVFRLIENTRPVLMSSVVDKKMLRQRYPTPHTPHRYGMRATLDRFNRHLTSKAEDGRVVIDSAGFQFDSQIRLLVAQVREHGTRIPSATYKAVKSSKLERIVTVDFQRSHDTAGIQLADAVAYATYARYERDQRRRFDQLDPFWRRNPFGGRWEPSVIPRPSPG